MKKTLLLLGLTAIVAVPSIGSAKMPLDIPPILATGANVPCTQCDSCDPACTNPCTPCATGCCGTTCKNNTDCAHCCDGSCSANACPPPPCSNCNPCADANCTNPCTPCANGCCGTTCKNNTDCAYCCEGGTICSADICPTPQTEWSNDTGIITKIANNDDSQYGRDTVPDPVPSDGHAGFSFTKLDSSGNPTTGTAVCIKDNVTGLTWSTDLGPSTLAGLEEIIQQNDNLCGLTGWRMPTIKELVSIVSYHRINPAIDTDFFPDTLNETYRSSTPNAADATTIWGVFFKYGDATNGFATDSAYRVRLVRPLP
jgi:hypothetical protein